MKNQVVRFVAVILVGVGIVVFAQVPASAQGKGIAFGIKPGLGPVQGSYFGYDAGTVQPFVGLDLVRLSASIDNEDASALLLVPNLGARMYFAQERMQGDVVPYAQGALLFSVASVSWDGADLEDESLVEEALGFWGLNLAFGSEYYFADKFSLGGEYGIRYFSGGVDKEDVSISLMMSYVSVALNFYLN